MYYCYHDTPIGELLLAGDEERLHFIGFPEGKMRRDPERDWIYKETPFAEARRQLSEYFAGNRKAFDLPLAVAGTEFQRRVLDELTDGDRWRLGHGRGWQDTHHRQV